MAWGAFKERDESGMLIAIHIVPTDAEGAMERGHILSNECHCISGEERKGRVPIYIHERVQ